MLSLLKLFISVLLWLVPFTISGNSDRYLDIFCKKQIPNNYEVYRPPQNEGEPGKPLNVYVKMKIIDIDEIDGANMDFRLHMYFKTFWNDTRLKRSTTLIADCSAYVWTPDVMFETAKEIRTFETTSTAFRVEESGRVIMTDRYSFKASCWMDFRYYPFDTQQCLFSVVFMTTFDAIAQLKWLDDESSPFTGESIEFTRNIDPSQYYLGDPTTHYHTHNFTYANFTYLIANFTLVRRLTGSIVSIYLPSTLVVMVSWVTFWLKPEAAPARVSLSVTSLLTLCTQVQQYKSQLPPVNYITAMDIWLFVCVFVVFASLLEFAVCYSAYIEETEHQKLEMKVSKDMDLSLTVAQEMKKSHCSERATESGANLGGTEQKTTVRGGWKLCHCCLRFKDSHKMDNFCRKYFPISFLMFAVVYWTFYSCV